MKKTLAAVAVLGAFAGSALAADVTLYGKVDLGLNYNHLEDYNGADTDTLSMKSGQNSGSRFGLKATEDLGNGTKVGFILENGFTADDGKLGQGSRLFGRESNLYLTGDFGTLSAGRVGALSSGLGSYNVVYGYTVFGTGWGNAASKDYFNLTTRDRFDNTLTYVTPNFAGFQAYAQYAFETNGQEVAGNERLNSRYAGIGAKYTNGGFSAGLVVDTMMKKADKTTDSDDSLGVSLGASYDFGVAKLFGFAQYGQNEDKIGDFAGASLYKTHRDPADATKDVLDAGTDNGVDGYALSIGATAPAFGGTFYAQANYVDAEDADEIQGQKKQELTGYGVALAYSYPLSKRTTVYGYAHYNDFSKDNVFNSKSGKYSDQDKTETGVGFGLVHSF